MTGEKSDTSAQTVIHPTAIVEDGAKIGAGSKIGPYCVIGAEVEIGAEADIKAHVVIAGRTRIGARARIYPFASIGHPPQDLKYKGEPTELIIGDDVTIREHVTINPGTGGGGGVTTVGDRVLLMVGAHVAHDCRVGDGVIMANNATLAGHVVVGDNAILGGLSAVHQFVRIGAHAMVGGMSGVENDVIPYGSVMGERAHLSGLNIVGLKRRGFTREDIHALRRAYRLLFADRGTMAERLETVRNDFPDNPVIQAVLAFIDAEGQRALCQPKEKDA